MRMKTLGPLVRVRRVVALKPYNVRIEFEDDTTRIIDLDRYLRGPVFEPIRDNPAMFAKVAVEGGTIAWPNGADIDPDVLYYDLEPVRNMEPEPV
jgi:hypothetical protein